MNSSNPPAFSRIYGPAFPLVLAVLLALFFFRSFLPGFTPFSNDGPLGRLLSQCHQLPSSFTGVWQDLEAVGFREVGAVPNITYTLRFLIGPLGFSKAYAPFSLLLLGFSAWFFFRKAGLSPAACALGGLAAALNSSFFSAACWGVAAHPITIAMTFLALAALIQSASSHFWLRTILAGLSVGLGISEGYDVGAIFSCCVAAFALYQGFVLQTGPSLARTSRALGRVVVMAVFAAFLSAQAIFSLVTTQIEGVVGARQDDTTKQQRWNWATQWSLPKREALGILVPGLFGYLAETPNGGTYWGAVGQDAAWAQYLQNGKQGPRPGGFIRLTGGGNYAGISVILVACWAAVQSLRRERSALTKPNRKMLWFWLVLGFVSLLLAFGRYAPFYRILYTLPYASTIRNPSKFLHILAFSLIILFGYGVDALWRCYLQIDMRPTPKAGIINWFKSSSTFDQGWVLGCLAVLSASVFAWCFYILASDSLVAYLQNIEFKEADAKNIAAFSLRQPLWFILFFTTSAGLILKILSKGFVGNRATLGVGLLFLLVVCDLGRANVPWIVYSNYERQYATNPIIERLRIRPYEHRVAEFPIQLFSPASQARFGMPPELAQTESFFTVDFHTVWLPSSFPRYNIQSPGVIQLSRSPEDMKAYNEAFGARDIETFMARTLRFWQLTNTRYLLGATDTSSLLNEVMDPEQHRFHIVERFQMDRQPGIVNPKRWDDLAPVPDTNGPLALFEFTGALPRAALYYQWQSLATGPEALSLLLSPSFNPERSVLITGNLPPPAPTAIKDKNWAAVEILNYEPKKIRLRAAPTAVSILLLNDRYDPNWQATIDGKPAPIVVCNYLMRGVHLVPGSHLIEFTFQPSRAGLYVSLCAIAFGLVLLGFVSLPKTRPASVQEEKQPSILEESSRAKNLARASRPC